MANTSCVLSFDGKRWEYVQGSNNLQCRKMAMDLFGRCYTGGESDFGYISADGIGRLQFVSMRRLLDGNGESVDNIGNVESDEQGTVAFMGKSVLYVYNGSRMVTHKSKEAFTKLLPSEAGLFVQSKNDGLYLVRDSTLLKVPGSNLLDSLQLKALVIRGDQKLLITHNKGIYRWQHGSLIQQPSGLDSISVWNLTGLSDKTYALTTKRNGVVLMNAQNFELEQVSEAEGLSSKGTLFPFLDDENLLWVAATMGLDRIEVPVRLRKLQPQDGSKLLALAVLKNGKNLLIGNFNGVATATAVQGRFTVKRIGMEDEVIRSLLKIDGRCLVGIPQKGIFIYKEGSLNKISLLGATSMLASNYHPEGTIFVGLDGFAGTMKGLARIRFKDGVLEQLPELPPVPHNVYDIAELPNGEIWAGYTQISRLQFPNGLDAPPVVSTFDSTQGFTRDHGDYDLWVYEGKLYFGTSRGFFHFDQQKQRLLPDSTFGLRFADQGNAAHHMCEDYQGNIWLYDGTHTGVLRRDENCAWQWDDLPLRRMEDQVVWSIYPAPDSIIWIGTTTTLYSYDPRIPKDYHVPFNTLIDRVTVGDTEVVFYGHYADTAGYLTLDQPGRYKLTFPYERNSIAFSYTATSYEYPEKTVFSHWLEGYEEEWSPWSAESDKSYGNLPEGTYTFHARSKNLYDTLGREAAYTFTILPPWYRTWWAYLLWGGMAVSVVALIVRWQVRRANRLQEAKQRLQLSQQQDLLRATVEGQENERARIAKDLHDDIQVTLSTAKLHLALLRKRMASHGMDKDGVDEPAALVQSAIDSVREISHDLLPASLARLGLVTALRELCESVDAAAETRVNFSVEGTSFPCTTVVELTLYRVCQELFANLLKHAMATEAKVELSYAAQTVTLNFQDNGRGFDMHVVREQGKGLGLKNMESRVGLVGGRFSFVSELGAGSEFTIEVPTGIESAG